MLFPLLPFLLALMMLFLRFAAATILVDDGRGVSTGESSTLGYGKHNMGIIIPVAFGDPTVVPSTFREG